MNREQAIANLHIAKAAINKIIDILLSMSADLSNPKVTRAMDALTIVDSRLAAAAEERYEAPYYTDESTVSIRDKITGILSRLPVPLDFASFEKFFEDWIVEIELLKADINRLALEEPTIKSIQHEDLKREIYNLKSTEDAFRSRFEKTIDDTVKLQSDLSAINQQLVKTINFLQAPERMANWTGAAATFGERAKEAQKERTLWMRLFGASLALLVLASLFILPDAFTYLDGGPSKVIKGIDYFAFTVRLAVLGPLLWGAWFSARQYGHATKIVVDYYFKAASAMSFQALLQSIEDISARTKILEGATAVYSDNPLRIYSIKSDPATPIQDLVETVQKLMSSAKEISFTRK